MSFAQSMRYRDIGDPRPYLLKDQISMVRAVMLQSLVALAVALYWIRNLPTAWANINFDKSHATSPASSLPVVDLDYTLQRATFYNVSPPPHASVAQLNWSFWFPKASNSYYSFLDIRYGESPTGRLRFAAPVAAAENRTIQSGGTDRRCYQG